MGRKAATSLTLEEKASTKMYDPEAVGSFYIVLWRAQEESRYDTAFQNAMMSGLLQGVKGRDMVPPSLQRNQFRQQLEEELKEDKESRKERLRQKRKEKEGKSKGLITYKGKKGKKRGWSDGMTCSPGIFTRNDSFKLSQAVACLPSPK